MLRSFRSLLAKACAASRYDPSKVVGQREANLVRTGLLEESESCFGKSIPVALDSFDSSDSSDSLLRYQIHRCLAVGGFGLLVYHFQGVLDAVDCKLVSVLVDRGDYLAVLNKLMNR